MHTTELYFECHITVAPVFGYGLEHFKAVCVKHGFRVANLLMRKSEANEPNPDDSFCTGRGSNYEDLKARMVSLIVELSNSGFAVWRYKIENTLLDSNYGDTLGIIDNRLTPRRHSSI